MKKNMVIVCFVVMLLFAVFSGCTENESSSNTKISNTVSLDESKEQEQLQEPETIEEIIAKTEQIDSMYYEISMIMDISEFGEQSGLIKIWQKEPYIKEEITTITGNTNISILVIQRPDGTYVYDAGLGQYVVSTDDISSVSTSLQYFDNDMVLDYISNISTSDYETEIIDGKEALVVEYSPSLMGNSIHVKMWIWIEKGVPLKGILDMNMEQITIKMELNYSNYSFSDIPDSIFNLT
jgi:outer membrane lipoprotein-sorting protein